MTTTAMREPLGRPPMTTLKTCHRRGKEKVCLPLLVHWSVGRVAKVVSLNFVFVGWLAVVWFAAVHASGGSVLINVKVGGKKKQVREGCSGRSRAVAPAV